MVLKWLTQLPEDQDMWSFGIFRDVALSKGIASYFRYLVKPRLDSGFLSRFWCGIETSGVFLNVRAF